MYNCIFCDKEYIYRKAYETHENKLCPERPDVRRAKKPLPEPVSEALYSCRFCSKEYIYKKACETHENELCQDRETRRRQKQRSVSRCSRGVENIGNSVPRRAISQPRIPTVHLRDPYKENGIQNNNFLACYRFSMKEKNVYKTRDPPDSLLPIKGLRICSEDSCLCCNQSTSNRSTFTSNTTGSTFLVMGPANLENNFICQIRNAIYVITCQVEGCGIQYVGLTEQNFGKRMNQHEYDIKNLFGHHKHFHSYGKASFQIIEILSRKNNSLLEKREDFWIRTLITFYPLGLNDRLYKRGAITSCKTRHPMYIEKVPLFFALPIPEYGKWEDEYSETYHINAIIFKVKKSKSIPFPTSSRFTVQYKDIQFAAVH